MKKCRGYCFTCNNYTDEHINLIKSVKYQYLVFGYEIAPETGTPHLQGYYYFKNPIAFTSLAKQTPGCHLIQATGNAAQNRVYCTKGGKFEEFGKEPAQGCREDLAMVRDEIQGGGSVEAICMDRPMLYHQYGRTMNKIEDICLRKKWRKEKTKATWYWGPPDTGKSHTAFEGYDSETHYVKCLSDKWWDGYTGQDTVLLNEFRGQLMFSTLLELADKWPMKVDRRNREPVPFISKHIIVTSPMHPFECYADAIARDEAGHGKLELARRFNIVHKTGRPKIGTEVVGG